MQDFNLYFRLGTKHILTWEAMDNILFVSALCLRYLLKDWKKVIVLVTAFTIGHSATLALSALQLVHFPAKWIEFLFHSHPAISTRVAAAEEWSRVQSAADVSMDGNG